MIYFTVLAGLSAILGVGAALYLYLFMRRVGPFLTAISVNANGLNEKHVDLVRQVGIINSDTQGQLMVINEKLSPIGELIVAASENSKLQLEEFNVRLVDLETQNKTTAPEPKDEDPLTGPRSWAAQAAAAERGAGIN